LPIEQQATVDLGSQQRAAQIVQVRIGERLLAFANGHYYWPPGVDPPRLRQIERLLASLSTLPPNTPIVSCGDFNGTAKFRAIGLMRQNFASAYVVSHGREPDLTFPTPLVMKRPLRSQLPAACFGA